jgi:hypothetical protein
MPPWNLKRRPARLKKRECKRCTRTDNQGNPDEIGPEIPESTATLSAHDCQT